MTTFGVDLKQSDVTAIREQRPDNKTNDAPLLFAFSISLVVSVLTLIATFPK